jgi:hypothetical protein
MSDVNACKIQVCHLILFVAMQVYLDKYQGLKILYFIFTVRD